MSLPSAEIKSAANLIKNAQALLVCTGAGMGVASNFGTFRGKSAGIWPPAAKYSLEFPELSDPEWFDKKSDASDPLEDAGLGYAFWQFRYKTYTGSPPHEGYRVISDWIKDKALKNPAFGGGFSFTSNIDGAWIAAGLREDQVWECHGSVRHMQCTKCESEIRDSNPAEWNMEVDPETHCAKPPFPQCTSCGERARPNVLMFGDWGFLENRERKQSANYRRWNKQLEKQANVTVVEIGAGVAIPTVRRFSEDFFRQNPSTASIIRINPEHPEFPADLKNKHGDRLIRFTDDSLICLKQIDELLKK
ncbi:hypothetical protein HK098_005371 [Nowakowskiella sp. JEL0407]|nr:hypothetical protein HK098_005371 [Nowakowskiella sp. JEL0407]